MEHNQIRFSREDIVEAIKENFKEFRISFASLSGGHLRTCGHMTWVYSGIPFAPWNSFIENHHTRNNFTESLQEIQKFINSQSFPLSLWITSESSFPNSGSTLKQMGFEFTGDTAGMARLINRENLVASSPSGFEIRQVKSGEELDMFLAILGKSFCLKSYCREALFSMFFSDMERQNPSMHHYLAFYEGIPAGCGTLFPAAGAGGIYYIGTLPQFRRRGVGEAVTRHCVKESCEAGYPLVVLRASDEGELLYRRLGFEEFLRFRLYRRQGIFVSSSKWKISVYCRRVYHKITGDASWFC